MCLTPSGRVIDLEPEHVYVKPGDPWERLFILGVSGRERAVAHATPAIELVDRDRYRTANDHSGPFRREHVCAA